SDFKLESRESLKWYQSSPQARRGFCSICGASLFWVPVGGDHVWIAAGTLDQPTGLRTVAHSYVADAGDYYTIADGLKTYPGTHLTAAVDK
ncbi:MAG TPA: GFA family protein, partial [Hyphomicrobiaceae bacterium]|nr:GFA family protein [Hyphomicrobiaceae bacterium]